jgi:hypothetical protein
MKAELTANSPTYRDILRQAAISYRDGLDRPQPVAVTEALLQAEKIAKQERIVYPLTTLAGQWRLCYTTGVRKLRRGGIALGKGFYLPKWAPAQIEFVPVSNLEKDLATASGATQAQGQIANQIRLGALQLRFDGPLKHVGKKNLLAFDFTQIQICFGDRILYKGEFRSGKNKTKAFADLTIAQLPFFSFFFATDECIAARGRGGGLALWIRER